MVCCWFLRYFIFFVDGIECYILVVFNNKLVENSIRELKLI